MGSQPSDVKLSLIILCRLYLMLVFGSNNHLPCITTISGKKATVMEKMVNVYPIRSLGSHSQIHIFVLIVNHLFEINRGDL